MLLNVAAMATIQQNARFAQFKTMRIKSLKRLIVNYGGRWM